MSGISIYIIIVNLLLAVKVGWDWYAKNKQKRIINHFRSALIDGLLYVVSAYFLLNRMDGHSLIDAVGAVAIATSWRWMVFDAIFAKINWGVFEFYGKSSKLDRFLAKMDLKWKYLDNLIKLIPALIGLALIIIW